MTELNRFLDELTRINNELANTQRELAKKNVELERLNAEKTRYLGMAAHDLRTPLGIIQTYSEFLIEDAGHHLEDEHLAFVHTIRDSSQFLLALIDDILDLSAIESGRLALECAPGDLRDLVARHVALNRVLAQKRGVAIRLETDGAAVCEFDPSKIVQALNNVLSNAIKYSPVGGEIVVAVTRTETAVRIQVKDQGPGIAAADQSRIFQPFSRSKTANPAGEHSTGLGLAITKRIVEGHGGRIWVESEPEKGAAFLVELPLAGRR